MKTAAAIVVLTSMVSSTFATPLALRAQMCNKAPTATTTSVKPIASPTAATAEACQQQCDANTACQSFVFGLAASASTPQCMLFNVAAAQVPSQGSNFNVFDKACASSSVPTQAPTHANPIGTNPSTTGGNTGTGSGNNNGNAYGNGKGKRADICGAKPAGPATQPASPFQTATNVASQQACLSLCQQTSGCQSCEFGKPSANGQEECLLFKVPASELPAPTNGQTFVAFDTKC